MNPPNPLIDSALHVLKGAVQKVLGTPITTAVFADGSKGRLTVEFNGEVNDAQLQQIEELANAKIRDNAPIEMLEVERGQAEKEFGTAIYDKFPVPAHIRTLSITRINEWNVNCCLGPHLSSTAEIGKLRILKHRNRKNRSELEISFEAGKDL